MLVVFIYGLLVWCSFKVTSPEKGDLWPVPELVAVIASPQSCDCNSATWHLVCIYLSHCIPWSHNDSQQAMSVGKLAGSHRLWSHGIVHNNHGDSLNDCSQTAINKWGLLVFLSWQLCFRVGIESSVLMGLCEARDSTWFYFWGFRVWPWSFFWGPGMDSPFLICHKSSFALFNRSKQ